MHAVTIRQPGGPEVLTWAEVPDPEPGPGEVVIDVVASAVNRADLLQRQGHYDPPPGTSPYLGLECSGRISRGAPGWPVGTPVCALLAGGGYAERVAVPVGQVLPVPAGWDLVDAAGLPEVACTVWSNLVSVARLRHGESLLVHGGGSGIGTFAIQFARALGARVFTTARPAKHEALRELGAELTIDYTVDEFEKVVREATDGRGVDVILDILGAEYLGRNIEALGPDGRLAVIGMQGGRVAEINLGAMMQKRATLSTTALRSRPPADKARIIARVREQVWPIVEAGRIRPVTDRRVPMAQAYTAHEVVARNEHLGKVLLVCE
jgi:putative PIG3 family NAD(P)H quinone oxidoreductase